MPEGSSIAARSIGLIPSGYKVSHFGREITGWSLKKQQEIEKKKLGSSILLAKKKKKKNTACIVIKGLTWQPFMRKKTWGFHL